VKDFILSVFRFFAEPEGLRFFGGLRRTGNDLTFYNLRSSPRPDFFDVFFAFVFALILFLLFALSVCRRGVRFACFSFPQSWGTKTVSCAALLLVVSFPAAPGKNYAHKPLLSCLRFMRVLK